MSINMSCWTCFSILPIRRVHYILVRPWNKFRVTIRLEVYKSKLDENGLFLDFVFYFYIPLTRASPSLCLDLFALNVSTRFATEFSTLCKSAPHSAHRSLPQGVRVIKVTFGNFEGINKNHRLALLCQ